MKLPTFLIIGAMKSGTTTLHRHLEQHPDIYMSPIKEPHYFSSGDIKTAPIRNWQEYCRLFEGANTETALGESSTTYLHSDTAVYKIKERLPNAKLIAIFRNPAEAAYSLYLMKYRSSLSQKSRDQVIQDFREIVNCGEKYGIIRGRFYSRLIQKYLDYFDQSQIKILLYDDLRGNSTELLKDVFSFLGVDNQFTVPTQMRYNSGGIPNNQLLHNTLNGLKTSQVLLRLIPKTVKPTIYDFYASLRSRNLSSAPPLPPDIRSQLTNLYREDILKFQQLISRDLSTWLNP